jgi:hypothetical protein
LNYHDSKNESQVEIWMLKKVGFVSDIYTRIYILESLFDYTKDHRKAEACILDYRKA